MLDPTGDARADLRAAHNASQIIATLMAIAQPGEEIPAEQVGEWRNDLRFYLRKDHPEEVVLSDDELAAIAENWL